MFTSQKEKKNEALSEDIRLTILRLSLGLKLSNPKLGRREAALFLFVTQMPPKDSGH